ncbi:MAG: hypothetical protein Q7S58_13255 [Candidatus Binatus sp.]|nr:hypothetical protein [Candidatus Binatus sp.]
MCLPTIAILSADPAISNLARDLVAERWRVEESSGSHTDRRFPAFPAVRIVIFDDETVDLADRSWLLAQIRKRAPSASMLYIAANHDSNTERQARINGAHYYCSKPIDHSEFRAVLNSFLRTSK